MQHERAAEFDAVWLFIIAPLIKMPWSTLGESLISDRLAGLIKYLCNTHEIVNLVLLDLAPAHSGGQTEKEHRLFERDPRSVTRLQLNFQTLLTNPSLLSAMTRFRPCIDLHAGEVKQIVGGTLDSATAALQTNYVSHLPPEHFAGLYKDNSLEGAHVIMLGPKNDTAAKKALRAWPGGLQVGGGINDKNASEWMEAGAEKVYEAVQMHRQLNKG